MNLEIESFIIGGNLNSLFIIIYNKYQILILIIIIFRKWN